MSVLEEILDGVSVLGEAMQFRSADDVKIIILVFVLVFAYPLFLVLKGRGREFFAGALLGGFAGLLLGMSFLPLGFLGSFILPTQFVFLIYILLLLGVIGIVIKVTYKSYRSFTWIFSILSLFIAIYIASQSYITLVSG